MKVFIGLILVSLLAGVEMRVIGGFGCPNGMPQVNCFVNPCNVLFSRVCVGHPDAICRANYCGGCTAEWVDSHGHKISC